MTGIGTAILSSSTKIPTTTAGTWPTTPGSVPTSTSNISATIKGWHSHFWLCSDDRPRIVQSHSQPEGAVYVPSVSDLSALCVKSFAFIFCPYLPDVPQGHHQEPQQSPTAYPT